MYIHVISSTSASTLNELIKCYRNRLGFSQEYMGHKLNIGQKEYLKIEFGTPDSAKAHARNSENFKCECFELLPRPAE